MALHTFFLLILILGISGLPYGFGWHTSLKNVDNTDLPYFAQIYNKRESALKCSGVIISQNYILTTSECIMHQKKRDIEVITGGGSEFFFHREQYHPVENFTIPRQNIGYKNNQTSWLVDHDIALIKLQKPIEFGSNQKPVRMRSTPLRRSDSLVFTGYDAFWTYKLLDHLQTMNATLVNSTLCEVKYLRSLKNWEYCADTETKEIKCKNWSGGPVVDKNGELVGLLPYSKDKCYSAPVKFTNILHFRSSILNDTGIPDFDKYSFAMWVRSKTHK